MKKIVVRIKIQEHKINENEFERFFEVKKIINKNESSYTMLMYRIKIKNNNAPVTPNNWQFKIEKNWMHITLTDDVLNELNTYLNIYMSSLN